MNEYKCNIGVFFEIWIDIFIYRCLYRTFKLSYYIGTPILDCLNKKIPKTEKYTEKILMYSNKYGNKAIFICRLLPVIRTLISLVSGVVRAEFGGFVLYSTMGISIWNIVLLSFGYFGVKVIIH